MEVVSFLDSLIPHSKTLALVEQPRRSCCQVNDARECANCSAPEELLGSFPPCTRCQLVCYCCLACQTQHWTAGEHEARCFTLSERSVQLVQEQKAEHGQGDTCVICLESLTSDSTQPLGCGHELHRKCIDAIKLSGGAQACPICRREFNHLKPV